MKRLWLSALLFLPLIGIVVVAGVRLWGQGLSAPATAAVVIITVALAGMLVLTAIAVPWRQRERPNQHQRMAALAELPPDLVASAKRYTADYSRPGVVAAVVAAAIGIGLGLTPAGPATIGIWTDFWLWQVLVGSVLLTGVTLAIVLPVVYWRHGVQLHYGVTRESRQDWAARMKHRTVTLVNFALLALLIFYTVVRLSPGWWWAWVGAINSVLVLIGGLLNPYLVTSKYDRNCSLLPEGPLKQRILALAEVAGVPVSEIYVASAAHHTAKVRASVLGYGPVRRIVVSDTMLPPDGSLTDDQVVAVLGHELVHAQREETPVQLALAVLPWAIMPAGLYLLGQWGGFMRWLGVPTTGDPRALWLAATYMSVGLLLSRLAVFLVTRQFEARADVEGLRLSGNAEDAVSALRSALATNLMDPDPGPVRNMLRRHPRLVERIVAMRQQELTMSGGRPS